VGLKGVSGQYKRRPQHLFEETSGKVGVPGVAVDHIRFPQPPQDGDITMKRIEKRAVALIIAVRNSRGPYAGYFPQRIALVLLTEAQEPDGMSSSCRSSQLSRQVFNVYARPSINMRREFFGQYGDIHGDTPQMKMG